MRKRVAPLMMLSVLILSLSGPAANGPALATLRGGCAKVDITPPLGIPLIGSYGKPSDAVMDELYAKALVLCDGDATIAIVSADLLYTPLEDITDPVRTLVQEKTGIAMQNIMVCGTHTHSGPEVFTRSKVPNEGRLPASEIDQAYLAVLIRRLADSVSLAHQDMREVRIGTAVGQLPEVVYNRRPRNDQGRVEMAFTVPAQVAATRRTEVGPDGRTRNTFTFAGAETQRTFGPIDPDVFVLRVEDANDAIVASLLNFGCHPVCVYPFESTAISADYPGRATRVVERAEGGISLFTLGLAGNAVPVRRGIEPCAQMGKALGGEALRRLQMVATTDDVTLQAWCREVTFPVKPPPEPEGETDTETPESVKTEIQVLRLGDLYILGLPAEVLIEVGLEIKRRAEVENLLIVTLANDAIGYVCHAQAYDEGGYEPNAGSDLAKGAGEIMIIEALALLDQINQVGDSNATAARTLSP